MVLHCQIKNKVFIWYEAQDIWILVHITNVTLCNTELINKMKVVSAGWRISCGMKRVPMLHLLRAKRCKTVTFCNARAPPLLVPLFVGRLSLRGVAGATPSRGGAPIQKSPKMVRFGANGAWRSAGSAQAGPPPKCCLGTMRAVTLPARLWDSSQYRKADPCSIPFPGR